MFLNFVEYSFDRYPIWIRIRSENSPKSTLYSQSNCGRQPLAVYNRIHRNAYINVDLFIRPLFFQSFVCSVSAAHGRSLYVWSYTSMDNERLDTIVSYLSFVVWSLRWVDSIFHNILLPSSIESHWCWFCTSCMRFLKWQSKVWLFICTQIETRRKTMEYGRSTFH